MAVSYADEGNMEFAISEIQNQYKIARATNDAAAMAGDNIIIGNLYIEQGQSDTIWIDIRANKYLMKKSYKIMVILRMSSSLSVDTDQSNNKKYITQCSPPVS